VAVALADGGVLARDRARLGDALVGLERVAPNELVEVGGVVVGVVVVVVVVVGQDLVLLVLELCAQLRLVVVVVLLVVGADRAVERVVVVVVVVVARGEVEFGEGLEGGGVVVVVARGCEDVAVVVVALVVEGEGAERVALQCCLGRGCGGRGGRLAALAGVGGGAGGGSECGRAGAGWHPGSSCAGSSTWGGCEMSESSSRSPSQVRAQTDPTCTASLVVPPPALAPAAALNSICAHTRARPAAPNRPTASPSSSSPRPRRPPLASTSPSASRRAQPAIFRPAVQRRSSTGSCRSSASR